jgi:hypothetical protein
MNVLPFRATQVYSSIGDVLSDFAIPEMFLYDDIALTLNNAMGLIKPMRIFNNRMRVQ